MEITAIEPFLEYYSRIRERTLKVIACIPPQHIEWTWKEGKFTLGDIVRHIGTIERYMYAENIAGRPSIYPGCGKELAEGYDNTLAYFNSLHAESLKLFSALTPEQLREKCITPGGAAITKWKWLRAMEEHEIHHRAQIYMYLTMLEVRTPPIFGLTAEEVFEKSNAEQAGNK